MKKFTVPLAALLVVMAIMAAYLWTQLGVEREQLAALQTRVAEMEKAAKDAAAAAASAASAQTAVVAGTTGTPPVAAATAAARTATPPSGKDVLEGVLAAVASNPDLIRRQLEKQFPDAARELDLSPAEEKKFFALLARQAAVSMDGAVGVLGGLNGDGAAQQQLMRKMLEQQQREDTEMAALLGARRHQQWQEYQGTVQARQQVQQLQAVLGSGANALPEEKAKPLIAALGQETARANRDMQARLVAEARTSTNLLEDQLKQTSEVNQRLVSAASPFLTALQRERYKQMLGQSEAFMRAIVGADAQGAATGNTGARR